MSVRYVNPVNHSAPAGRYNHVAIAGPGRFAFIAGQIALDSHGSLVGPDDSGAQFRQVFRNLKTVLDGIGAKPSGIVELRTFLVGEASPPFAQRAKTSTQSSLVTAPTLRTPW